MKKRKLLSILLAAAMALSPLPSVTLPALAASNTYYIDYGYIKIEQNSSDPSKLDVTYSASLDAASTTDTIAASDPITISQTDSSTSAAHYIYIGGSITDEVNLTLDGVNIDDSTKSNTNALAMSSGTTLNLTLTGDNTLKSGTYSAGMGVDAGATLNITADSSGSLTATGGRYAAGIGCGLKGTCGTVNISGGTVTATGGVGGAGIGGGDGLDTSGGTGATVYISGGSVKATAGGSGAEAIGHGARCPSSNSGTLQNNSGTSVYLTTVTLADGSGTGIGKTAITSLTASLSGADYSYGTNGMSTDSGGVLYLYLPGNTVITEAEDADGVIYTGRVTTTTSGGSGTLSAPTNASITPTIATFDLYALSAKHEAVSVTLTAGSYTLSAIKNGTTELTLGADYTVSDNTYTFPISYLATLAAGTQTITFDMSGGTDPTLSITIKDTTPSTTYSATVSPESKTFTSATAGYSAQTAQEFTITNTGTGTLTSLTAALTTGTNFEISTALSSDSVASGGTAAVSVRPKTGLLANTYTDTLTITGDNGISLTVELSFTVTAATTYTATVSPESKTFTSATVGYGAQTAQEFTITNTGTGTLTSLTAALTTGTNFEISTALSSESVASGGIAMVSVRPKTGLSANTYTDTLTITDDNGISLTVNLSFTVNAATTYSTTVSPESKVFTSATAGYDTQTAQVFTITNTGTGSISNLSAALTTGTNFEISTALSSDSVASGGIATVSVRPKTSLTAGTYTDTLTITGDNGISKTVSLSFTVSSASSGSSSFSASSSSSTDSDLTVTTDSGTGTTTVTKTVTATTKSNGTAAASVTASQISKMLEAASAEGSEQTVLTIELTTADDATGVSVAIPQAAVTSMTSGKASLSVTSDVATVTFDSTALAAIASQTSGAITITANEADTSSLSDEAVAAIGDRPVYALSITSGDTTVSSFGGGTATVSIPYTLADGEDMNAIVIYYINSSGELVMVPNCVYDAETGTITFTTTHFSTYAVGYNAVSFSDVSDSAWYSSYVSFLAARGIVGGNDGAFSPDASITRAEFVTILARMSGDDLSSSTATSFTDVAVANWYFAAVQWAVKAGIASGYDSKFSPDASITREQMAAMLYRYTEYKGTVSNAEGMSVREFCDYDSISSWAQAPIQWAMNNGIISGNPDGSFAPQSSATRAQAAKMIALLLQGMVG